MRAGCMPGFGEGRETGSSPTTHLRANRPRKRIPEYIHHHHLSTYTRHVAGKCTVVVYFEALYSD